MIRLEATLIVAGYGRTDVLRSLDVSVTTGEFVGLIGRNGCGKSTLLRVLTHVLACSQGEVTLEGRDIRKWSALERARRIAFVPQQESAYFDFTVRDIVLMGRYPHRKRGGLTDTDFAIADSALRQTDTLALAERPVTQLSGGEHRRVLLARALAQDAPLLLMDEPTAHLDIAHQAEIMQTAHTLAHTQGRGVLAALHDLNQAAEFCDRLVLMLEGKVVADGTPEQVITPENLREAYSADAEIETNPITGRPYILRVTPLREALPPSSFFLGDGN